MAAMTECLKANNKFVYVSLLVIQTLVLLIDFIPGASPYTHWLTPPVALFQGLAFALLCGQAIAKIENLKVALLYAPLENMKATEFVFTKRFGYTFDVS